MRTITLSMIDRSRYDENESGVAIETTVPVDMQAESIRAYYPRKGGRVGTRITFTDRGGFAVAESFEQVRATLAAAGIARTDAAPAIPVLALAAPQASEAEASEAEASEATEATEAEASSSSEASSEAPAAPRRNGRRAR